MSNRSDTISILAKRRLSEVKKESPVVQKNVFFTMALAGNSAKKSKRTRSKYRSNLTASVGRSVQIISGGKCEYFIYRLLVLITAKHPYIA